MPLLSEGLRRLTQAAFGSPEDVLEEKHTAFQKAIEQRHRR